MIPTEPSEREWLEGLASKHEWMESTLLRTTHEDEWLIEPTDEWATRYDEMHADDPAFGAGMTHRPLRVTGPYTCNCGYTDNITGMKKHLRAHGWFTGAAAAAVNAIPPPHVPLPEPDPA